jgi:long-chain fatty acid transport protein
MTRLDRTQLMATALGLDIQSKFEGQTDFSTWNNNSTDNSGNGHNGGAFTPAGSLNYVYAATPELRFGLTLGSYFGLGVDYGDDWQGRYYVQKAELLTMGINPSAAYRVNDWLSVGAGFTSLYGKLKEDVAINNRDPLLPNDPPTPDGTLKIDSDDWGWGYNLGLLLEPTKSTRIGVTYRSKIELDFKDVAKTEGVTGPIGTRISDLINNSKLDMKITMPQAVTVSGVQQVTDKLALMANIGWQDWSQFGKVGVDLSTPSASGSSTVDAKMKDTWHGAIGGHYRVAEPLLLMLGFAYDT